MSRVRNIEKNDSLKKVCLAHFRYEEGDLYVREDTPLGISRTRKYRMHEPIKIKTQGMTTSTGAEYNYAVEDVKVNGAKYKIMRSRLVWLLVHGEWPTGNILHKDGNNKNCYHENLVEVSPRLMHIYTRMVRHLDKNKIAHHISTKRERIKKGKKLPEISVPSYDENDNEYKFQRITVSKNSSTVEVTNRIYDGTLGFVTHAIHDKLSDVNLEQYHVNKNRHQTIMREYRKRYGDSQ